MLDENAPLSLSAVPRKGARTTPGLVAASLAGAIAAVAYSLTLLPGLDLGDTASFQTTITLPLIVPRHAYPLYFALGKVFALLPGNSSPAHAMNVLSAAAGVAAVAAFAWFAWMLTGRGIAAFWSAILFASSYTFWSQAVIAEVYTLEAFFIALVFIAALSWYRHPTGWRLAWLYAVYALSFGNHLSMILLAPGLLWILWAGRSRATLNPFSGAGILAAAVIAAAGAMQYAWNFWGLWAMSVPRPPLPELLSTFWFDVTKSDWRASLVGTVPVTQWGNRLAMYWWDLQQQFGLVGVSIATFGLIAALRASPLAGLTLALVYATTFAFAFIYNVGDTHVFLLPSHQVVATFAACGAAALLGTAARASRIASWIVAAALLGFSAWRLVDTFPAVDRSADHRADRFAEAALSGLTPEGSVYLEDLNWQTQNAVSYHLATSRSELPHALSPQVLWHFPEFVRRNRELGRDVVLTKPAADAVASAYGTLFTVRIDERLPIDSLTKVGAVPRGTPYVLVVMTPLPENQYDASEVARVASALSGASVPRARYLVVTGLSGSAPVLNVARNRPFRVVTALAGHRVEVRIESWLPADTMRRAGFGHVIVDRRHTLTLERGATLGTFNLDGTLRAAANQGGSFALQPRYVIPVLR